MKSAHGASGRASKETGKVAQSPTAECTVSAPRAPPSLDESKGDPPDQLQFVQQRVQQILTSFIRVRRDDVCDVLQTIMLAASPRKCPSCRLPLLAACEHCDFPKCEGKTLLDLIARRRGRDQIRKYQRERGNRKIEAPTGVENVPDDRDGEVFLLVDNDELVDKVIAAIRHQLTKTEREVVMDIIFNNLAYRQISEQRDIALGTVFNIWHRARKKLQAALSMQPSIGSKLPNAF